MEPILPDPEARAPPALADHLLEEILVWILDPADLARATAACKAFHRLIKDPTFLRRYRSLHPPLLLGFVEDYDFLPVEAPHPNAAAARTISGAAVFHFRDYLPPAPSWGWQRCDARDGRFLVESSEPERGFLLPELAVCDPLTRECTLLPPIPNDLVISTLVQVQEENIDSFNAFFDPSVRHKEPQFRVMCWTCSEEMAAVFLYSSACGSWTLGASVNFNALGLNVPDIHIGWCPSYAYGSLYWEAGLSNKFIKLDINSMEFSIVNIPGDHGGREIVVVEAGEGRIGLFSLILDHDLWRNENLQPLRYSIIMQNERENANELPVETTVPLPLEYNSYHIFCATQGYPYLIGTKMDVDIAQPLTAFYRSAAVFSLDIKTLKVERVCLANGIPDYVIPYFRFPPFMSPRRM